MQSDAARETTKAVTGESVQTTHTHCATRMEDNLNVAKTDAEPAGGSAAAKTPTPSRKRYTRAQLMNFRETIDLTGPPVGYNPALLKPVEPLNKDMQMPREGVKWNKSRSLNNWPGPPPGQKGGMPPFSRLADAGEDLTNGPHRGGRGALRSAISWNEQQPGAVPTPDKNFGRRSSGSRSDAPGRWDYNKEDQPLSRSLEKRGSERWGSYGHRDSKDKPPKPGKEEECIEPPSQEPYHDLEPEWMHHRPSADNAERIRQQRQFAQDFEEERKLMREKGSRDIKERSSDRGESTAIMTDEEINDFKKQLEAEERGMASSVFTFDSLKEALKSQGVSNLPPMPTSGISTVDQIERSLKASANTQMPPASVSDLERQKLELLRAASGQGNMANPAATAANIEGANRLLSMLRGQVRPAGPFGNLTPAQQLQQQLGGIPGNLSQQPGLMAGGNTQLERLFAANRVGATFNPGAYGAQQPQVHHGIGNVPNLPFMQQAGQFNPRNTGAALQNSLLSALLANQTQNRQKQAMLAHLHQAQQQTAMQNARAETDCAQPETGEDDGEGRGNTEPPGVQPNILGLLPGVTGVQNQVQLPSFGLQGNLMGVRPSMPANPGMFNPSMVNVPVANPQSMFTGGMPQVNPGLGGHPSYFVQNGGGLARPVAPGLSGMNFAGMRPGMGGLGSVIDDRQVPVLNGQPNALQASLLAAQQGSSGLNRFFGEHNVGVPGAFPSDQAGVAPARNRSLEELKNEAQ